MLNCFDYLMPQVAALMILLYHAFPAERTVFFFSFICYLCISFFHRKLCRLCDSSRLASFLLFCIVQIFPEIFLERKFSSASKRYLIWVRDKWTDSHSGSEFSVTETFWISGPDSEAQNANLTKNWKSLWFCAYVNYLNCYREVNVYIARWN